MEANELRIGNWLKMQGVDKPYQVFIIDTTETKILTKSTPIPLTEEWLVSFGFEIKTGGLSYNKNKLSIYLGDTILSGDEGRTYFNSWAILEHSPKHVHQLQNLYYALTGEELVLTDK